MKNRWLFSLLAILLVFSLVLSACKPAAEEPAAEEPAAEEPAAEEPAAEEPAAEEPAVEEVMEPKVATFAWTQEPDSLNPFYTDMWFSAILQQLYLCWAWEYDDQNQAYPNLVTEIPSIENGGLTEDGLTITMHLRDDIVWSDGTPITSAVFKFTYDTLMTDANAVNSQYPYDALTSVETPDPLTVVMNFSEPFSAWQANFWHGILPAHILQPVFDAEGSIMEAEWNLAPTVGCGPYVFGEWESGSFLRFVKNENYWKGAAKIDDIFLQFVPDDAAQTAALVAGDADLGAFVPLSDIPTFKDAGLSIFIVDSGYAEGWFFNLRDMASPAIKDLVVRQAIAMSIDRDAISNDLLLGLTHPVDTLWDPIAARAYVSPDIVSWSYDPEGAKAMLEAAGYVDSDGDGIREDLDGNPLTLVHGTTIREIRQDIQAVAQQQLREVGINLDIQSQDSDIFFGGYSDGAPPAIGEQDIMEWSDSTYFPDPDTDYWLCAQLPDDENPYGYNYYGCDEELDALFQAQIVETDPAKRVEIFHDITKYMHDNVFWFGLYNDPDYWIVNSALTGVKFSGVTPFYNIIEWDFAE
ncbi:MAG: peptide ABC transporter substrate-binding protein [Chloroflexi bacterium]|nr:peptide ABC transporter substrate-binding protein [Chloroflexota bacterium]